MDGVELAASAGIELRDGSHGVVVFVKQRETATPAIDRSHIRGNVAFVFGGFGDPRGFQVITDILSDRSDRPHPGVGGGNRTLEAQIGQDRYYAVHLWVNSAIHGRSRFLSHC